MVTRTGTSRPLHRIKAFWTTLEAGMHRLIAVGMIEALAISLFVSLLVPWYKSLGYDSTTQGWLRFVLQITSAVVAAAGGILADRLGRKNMYTAGQLFRCAAIVVLLSTRSFTGLIIVSVIRGLSIIQSPPRTAFIAAYTVKENRATTLGIYQTTSLIANMIAPLAAGFLADRYGVKPPLFLALALAIAAIFMAVPLGQPDRDAKGESVFFGSPDCSGATAASMSPSASETTQTIAVGHLLKKARVFSSESFISAGRDMFMHSNSRGLIILLVAWLANGLTNGAINILLPFTVMDKFSSTYKAVAALDVFSSLGTVLVLLIGGRIADLKGRRRIILTTGFILPLLMSSILWIDSLWQLYGLLALSSMAGNISSPAIMAANIEAVDEKYRATWDGFTTGMASAGMAAGSVLGGVMYKVNSTWAWTAVITLFILQIACFCHVFEQDTP
ncbi:MAG TPA: MFS transporter [Firmicutes bacterium]|jgi:MFS family permease|nr:MFS transporter [Bacillota bacterium]